MAIINSIILGRAKGSIGNVTLSTQGGRVIARQKPAIVGNPNTALQQEQRSKLAKAVLAWQSVGNYLKSGITSLLPFSSAYNTFVSKNIEVYANKPFAGVYATAEDLRGSFATLGAVNRLTSVLDDYADGLVIFTYSSAELSQFAKIGDKLKFVGVSVDGSQVAYSETLVTADVLSGVAPNIQFKNIPETLGILFTHAFWFESADGKTSSTSVFE